jgi:aminopeptidase C
MANKTVNKSLLKSNLARWAELENQRLKLAAKLDPIVKEQKSLEKEIGALTLPVTNQPPLIKDFAIETANLSFDTRTERTVAPQQWFERLTKKDRDDEQFWGTIKVLVEKADKYRPVIVTELASVAVTYKPKLELK